MSSNPSELLAEIRRLKEENAELTHYRSEYQRLRRDTLIEHLLKGKYPNLNTILADLAQFGIVFRCRDYMLAAIQVITPPDEMPGDFAENNYRMEQLAQQAFEKSYECTVSHMDSGLYCLLGSTPPHKYGHLAFHAAAETASPKDNPIFIVKQLALELYDKIKKELGLEVFLAISRPFPGVSGFYNAFRDSEDILSYHQQMGLDVPMLCYHDFEMAEDDTKKDYMTSLRLESEYMRQVEIGDYSGARKTLHMVLKHSATHSLMSLHTAKLEIHAKLHLLLVTSERIQGGHISEIHEFLFNELLRMPETITYQQLQQLIDEVFDQIDAYVWQYHSNKAPKWLSDVLAYIAEHFRETYFNVAELSEHFQMSPAYLSREFRKSMECSLLDYIQMQRLQLARAALAEGTSVKDAAGISGFGDSRALRRAFQKYLQANPSEYCMKTGEQKAVSADADD